MVGAELRSVRSSAGEIRADCAVVAAATHSKSLAEQMGDLVPLDTERGYQLMIADPEVRPKAPTSSMWRHNPAAGSGS
jgi:D-amino-acid dehydrogenase